MAGRERPRSATRRLLAGRSGYFLGKLPVWLRLTRFGSCLDPVLLRSISQVGPHHQPFGRRCYRLGRLASEDLPCSCQQTPGLSRCSYRRSVRRRVPKYLPLSARGYPRADSSAHPEFSDRRLGSRDRVISPKPAYHGILRSPLAPRDCEQQSAASLGLKFDRSCGEVVTEAL